MSCLRRSALRRLWHLTGTARFPSTWSGFERAHAEEQAGLEEARSLLRACEIAVDHARNGSHDTLARLVEERLAAQVGVTKAETRVEHSHLFVERARERLPEDDLAEAHARIADAQMHVDLLQSTVDSVRADLLPERLRDALKLLAAHATDEWLDRYGPADPARRRVVRPPILGTIEGQLATAMFRPQLGGLDHAINITGSPSPSSLAPTLPDAPGPGSTGPADTLNHLRFGTLE